MSRLPPVVGVVLCALLVGCTATQTPVVRQGRDTEEPSGGDRGDAPKTAEPYGPLLAQGPDGNPGGGPTAEWERERDRRMGSRKEISQHYYESGRRLFDEQKINEAKRNFFWSVEADPTNIDAQRMLDLCSWMLEERDGEVRFSSKRFADEKRVLIDQKRVEVERFYDAGRQAFTEGDYPTAVENLERAIEIVQWFPYEIPTETADFRARAEQLLGEAKKKQRQFEIAERIDRERKAYQDAKDEEGEVQRQKERRIRTLIERCMDLLNRKSFKKAEEVANEILENFDSRHPHALKLRQLAIEGRHLQEGIDSFDLEREHGLLNREAHEEVFIPFADPIIWPSKAEWDEMRSVRKVGISEEDLEPEWVTAAKQKLQLTVPLDFVEKPLSEVIDEFRRMTDLNFFMHPDVDGEREVHLVVPEITIENALKVILKETDYTMDFSDEAIMILPEDAKVLRTFLEIYPADDLLTPITNFTAPDLSVQDPGDQAGGGGGGFQPFSFGGDDDDDDSEPLDEDKLVELIQAQTGEEAWEDSDLTSIEVHRGQLLVRNTREVHAIVREVLEQLRANSGIYVVVETRFIDVFDDFLQDIGVDFGGLGAGNPSFGSQFNLARQQSAIEGGRPAGFSGVGFTSRNVTPGLGSGLNPGPGPGQENFAGRMANLIDRFPSQISAGSFDSGQLLGGGGGTLVATLLEPFQISAIIRAERVSRIARLVDSPTVVAHDRQKVYVSVVTQQSYISDYDLTAQSFGDTAVEIADPVIRTFEQGVSLEVRPTVSADRKYISLDLRLTLARGTLQDIVIQSLGTITQAASQVPIQVPLISLQQAWTSITIPDGGTAVLGGFRLRIETEDESSVPFLSNIPIVDLLFKREVESKTNKSLIILVTARVVVVRDEEKKRFNED